MDMKFYLLRQHGVLVEDSMLVSDLVFLYESTIDHINKANAG